MMSVTPRFLLLPALWVGSRNSICLQNLPLLPPGDCIKLDISGSNWIKTSSAIFDIAACQRENSVIRDAARAKWLLYKPL